MLNDHVDTITYNYCDFNSISNSSPLKFYSSLLQIYRLISKKPIEKIPNFHQAAFLGWLPIFVEWEHCLGSWELFTANEELSILSFLVSYFPVINHYEVMLF